MNSEKFNKRLPIYRFLAAALILITVVICSIQQILDPAKSDPHIFIHASRLMLQRRDIVNVPNEFGLFYVYPPFLAAVSIPLILLPMNVVIFLWTIVSVILLGWSMTAFYGGMMDRPFFSIPQKTRWAVCFLSVLCTARFIFFHLREGQSDIFVLALAVLGLVELSKNQRFRSGIAIGLSILIKATTLPFVFWFAARRSGRVLTGLVFGCLIAVALPACIVGVKEDLNYHREWFNEVVSAHNPGSKESASVGDISLREQVDRFFLDTSAFEYHGRSYHFTIAELPAWALRLIVYSLMFAITVAIIYYAVRYRNAPPLVSQWGGFALVFSLVPSFSIWTEVHHLVLLVPAYMYVVHLWHSQLVTDRLFRVLVLLSFVFTTLTTRNLCGVFLSRLLTSLGFINYGMLLLSAAIFRAAICLENSPEIEEAKRSYEATKGVLESRAEAFQ